jgi:hypothetical protein
MKANNRLRSSAADLEGQLAHRREVLDLLTKKEANELEEAIWRVLDLLDEAKFRNREVVEARLERAAPDAEII